MSVSELDYITKLIISIIDLDEEIQISVDYNDLLVRRDALLSIWNNITLPDMTDTQYETLSLLIVCMDELNDIVDNLILKRVTIHKLCN